MREPFSRADRWSGIRAAVRGATMALFVASSLLQSAGTLPEAGLAHVRCAEHGELTHAEAPKDTTTLGPRQPAPATGASRAMRGSAPVSGTHEHCPYAAVLDQPAPTLSVAPTFDGVPMTTPPRPAPPAGRGPWNLRVVLDSAPKTSPPLV